MRRPQRLKPIPVGSRFSSWTTIGPVFRRLSETVTLVACQCACGAVRDICVKRLRQGKTHGCKSCAVRESNKKWRPPIDVRFWNLVTKTDGCWTWRGFRDEKGYGMFSVGRLRQFAHRFAWQLEHGPLQPGECVLHTCDNPPCVRHLFKGSIADNNADKCSKNRQQRGVGVPNSLLTDDIVRSIRKRYQAGELQRDLGLEFGVTPGCIGRVIRLETWKHVVSGNQLTVA